MSRPTGLVQFLKTPSNTTNTESEGLIPAANKDHVPDPEDRHKGRLLNDNHPAAVSECVLH